MFEKVETLLTDLRAFAADPSIVAIPYSVASHEVGAGLLRLAAGRTPHLLESLAPGHVDFETAERFLSLVIFDQKNNYFTLLCVDRDAPDEAVRENYRRLIALVHPDAMPIGFPADAASRVNLGYAVLSNPAARAAYTESLDRFAAGSALTSRKIQHELKKSPGPPASKPKTVRRAFFSWVRRPRFGFGLLALAAVLLAPVLVVLTSMARDSGNERLISSRQQSNAGVAVQVADTNNFGSAPVEPLQKEALSTAGTENTYSAHRTKPATHTDERVRDVGVAVVGPETSAALRPSSERRNVAVPIAPKARHTDPALTQNPVAMQLRLAPTLSSLPVSEGPTADAPENQSPRPTVSQNAIRPIPEVQPDSPFASRLTLSPRPPVDAKPATNGPAQTSLTPDAVAAQRGGPVKGASKPSDLAGSMGSVGQDSETRVAAAQNREIDDLIVRFNNVYETGSLSGLQQLLAPSMPGRSQTLAEYDRLFQASQSRRIRFAQLKFVNNGTRISSAGPATVVITYSDKRIVTQKIYLEIDMVRSKGDLMIERVANYVVE